jgi:hypothetical protein
MMVLFLFILISNQRTVSILYSCMCICITDGQTFVSYVSYFMAVILWNLLFHASLLFIVSVFSFRR